MPNTLKQLKVTNQDNTVVDKADRIKVQVFVNVGGTAIEAEALAYPYICRAGLGALPAQEVQIPVKFTPSAALAAALLSEVMAAVNAEVAKA